MKQSISTVENKFTGNTTLVALITNARFNKSQLCKLASMAQDGMARAINPVHTSADGDSVIALSIGDVQADMDLTGIIGAEVTSKAILIAILSAKSAYGYPSVRDIKP